MEIRVSSFAQLIDELYAGSWKPQLGRFRSAFAYRGISDAREPLRTSLMRLGEPYGQQEGHLLRNFRKYAGRGSVPRDSVWNWLALGKHHGLPTRLLDWSFSPYVAMHFTTQDLDYYDRDGVIWCVDYVAAHKLLPRELRAALDAEEADVLTAEMLDTVADSLSKFDSLKSGEDGEREDFVMFLEPPSLDDRIVNQFAMFSLMSSATASMDEWLKQHSNLWRRLIIPAELKWEVRDKLDQANITERVLFPGLDGLSRWLRRYYTPKDGCEKNDDQHEPPDPDEDRNR
jgi:hypothetical protein